VQGDAEDERSIKHDAPDGPAVQRGLDVLVVKLGWTEGRDTTGRRETMDDHVDREDEGNGVAGRGERAGEWSWRWWRGKETLEEGARGVHEQGPKDEVTLAEYGLVVLPPEHLIVHTTYE
jgi:hypothetical protein